MAVDRLYYFSRSANKYPGLGVNEYVSDPIKYIELSKINSIGNNWRQMLSNFWVAPFEVEGIRWNTIEHMFQGYKINIANSELGYLFSLNSNSSLSKSPGEEAQKNRKLVLLSSEQLEEWEDIKDDIMYYGLLAKFTQNPELKEVLLLTQDAELWHGAPRVAPSRQYLLESVRSELSGINFRGNRKNRGDEW